jgi:hypothetical protein
MKRSLFAVVAAAAVALLALAGSASAVPTPPFPDVAGTWSHAEINVQVGRQPHTLILDRGIVTRVSRASLRVRESDGNIVSMPVARRVQVSSAGGPVPFAFLRTGWSVETMRIDGGAAVRIRIL